MLPFISGDSEISQPAASKGLDVNLDVPSLTPPPSDENASAFSPENVQKSQDQRRSSNRLRPVNLIKSYNENILSGSARKRRRKEMTSNGFTVDSNTLIGADDTQQHLIADYEHLVGPKRAIGALPGENTNTQVEEKCDESRRRSSRLSILDRVTRFVEKTTSVIGKRGRDPAETGIQRVQTWPRHAESSGDSNDVEVVKLEGPPRKRARMSHELREPNLLLSPGTESELARPKIAKRWLTHGLYIGQDHNSGMQFSQKKNNFKKPSDGAPQIQPFRFLPMPMYAGHRMIELGRDFKLPFDVFSPLPPGLPRPEEWKKTHKNVFIGEAASVWKKAKPLESSRCVCRPERGCDEECFNRFMFYECDNTNCDLGADICTNRSFEHLRQRTKAGSKYSIGVEVVKTPDRGHGVRSNRCFEPNQIIVEYTGEIITQEECDNRMNKRYKDSECYYLMDFDQQMILDATRGSIARFVNHSCEPNCKMVKWTVSGTPRMALFAGEKEIITGEELTYDYNFSPYSVKNVQQCRCGAPSCRGILGPKPKEIREALKPLTTVGKRKLQQAFESTVEIMVKRHKPVVSSMPRAFAAAKDSARKKLTKGKHILRSSSARNEKFIRNFSAKVVGNTQEEEEVETIQETENPIKRHVTVTYSRRRQSAGTNVKHGTEERPADKKSSFQPETSIVKETAVGTTFEH